MARRASFGNKASPFLVTTVTFALVFSWMSRASAIDPLPRIAPRPSTPFAEFYNTDTGETFTPIGNNYVKLEFESGAPPHITFTVDFYDAEAAENALAQMARDGYNIVRVWVDAGFPAQRPNNFGAAGPQSTDSADLYQPFLDNFVDFITRANRHQIYVIPVCDWIPNNSFYGNLSGSDVPANVGGVNKLSLAQSGIDAKILWMQQLVEEVASVQNGALLSTIFSWEIQNELFAHVASAPFDETSGTVTPADGITYDMADPDDRRACFDNNFNRMLDQVVAGVQAVDPDAMVSSSVFTFDAVGKPGPAGILPLDAADVRFPPRPLQMLESDISYIDIHVYPDGSSTTFIEDVNSSEYSSMDLTQKPLLLGEFGAFPDDFSSPADAADAIVAHRQAAFDLGFQGALLWTWDTPSTTFNALEGNGELNVALSPRPNSIELDSEVPFIEEGTVVSLVSPPGVSYQWTKDGATLAESSPRVTGTTSQVLTLDPALASDSGVYTVEYGNALSNKAVVETEPFALDVLAAGSLPAVGLVGMGTVAALIGLVYWYVRGKRAQITG